MGNEMEVGFLLACFALGMLGAGLGAWAAARTARALLKAQRQACESASKQAQRDLQQALLCVPQWVQRAARIELELLGRQHTERHKALLREQQLWQSEQQTQREAEWRTLLSGFGQTGLREALLPGGIAQAKKSAPVPMPAAPDTSEAPDMRSSLPATTLPPEEPERMLSDEEIDALPPDLPAPVRLQRRKMSASNKPTLRNI